MPGVQFADNFCSVRVGIFDVLRFVQHHQMPGLRLPAFTVTLQQRIRCNHNVMSRHAGCHLVALAAVQHQHAQTRREAHGLAPPVPHQTDRGHDQHRQVEPSSVLFSQDVGQRLQRFAQPHVVSQNAAQPVRAQKLQPSQALQLVGTQLGHQPCGRGQVGQGAVPGQLADHFAQLVRALPASGLAAVSQQRRTHTQRLQARQTQPATFEVAVFVATAFGHQLQQRLQPRPQRLARQAQIATTVLLEIDVRRQLQGGIHGLGGRDGAGRSRFALGACRQLCQQLRQQRQNIAPYAIDVHAQRQTEPRNVPGVQGVARVIGIINISSTVDVFCHVCACLRAGRAHAIRSKVLTFRAHKRIQPFGACNPAAQMGLGGHAKAAAFKPRKTVVEPLKPLLLLGV